jgi:cell division protein FtsL
MTLDFLKLNKIYKIYILNIFLFLMIIFTICSMFFVQFKTNNLISRSDKIDIKISDLKTELKILQIEWVYLTRPERLRILSDIYLENQNITLLQIKNIKDFEAETVRNNNKLANLNL